MTSEFLSRSSGPGLSLAVDIVLGTLSKTQRQRQQECHQTRGLMSKTIAAKQPREMSKFCVVWRT